MGVLGGGELGGGLGGAGGGVVPPPGALTSFAGRLGPAILPQFSDYTAALIVDTSLFATANVELALNAAKALAESKLPLSPIDGVLYAQLDAVLTPITSANVPDATAGLGPTITASLATLNASKLPKSPVDGVLYGQVDGSNTAISAANSPAAGPYAATLVQQALDLLRLNLGGGVGVVDSLADLDVYAPAVAGVRTITRPLLITNIITLPANERIVFGAASAIVGLTSARCQILGDIDGPLFSGAAVMREIGTANVNVGASAMVFAITSPGGRTVRIEYCAIGAGAKAGTISNVVAALSIDRMLIDGANNGFVMSGVVAAFEAISCAYINMPAGSIMFDFAASTVIVVALNIESCSFLTGTAADRGIRISSSATLPGAPVPTTIVGVNIIACKLTGPGLLYDEGAGSLTLDSPKLIVMACPALPNSKFLGDADFENFTTPILTTYVGPAPTAFVPLAHQNVGPTSVLTLLSSSARFTLVRNVGVTDWYLRYDGPSRQTATVHWSITLEANIPGGAGEFIECRAEVDVGGVGVWASISGSSRRIEQRATAGGTVCDSFVVMNAGDRFRLSSSNVTGTSTTKVYQYDLIVGHT